MPGPQRPLRWDETPSEGFHPDPNLPSLPTPTGPGGPVTEDRFYRELAEVVAWQQVNDALYGLRKIADLLLLYPDGWAQATITEIGDTLQAGLVGLLGERDHLAAGAKIRGLRLLDELSEDELRAELFKRMCHAARFEDAQRFERMDDGG